MPASMKLLPAELTALIRTLAAAGGLPITPTTANGLNFADNAAFKAHLGMAPTACMRYELFGECKIPNCPNQHDPQATTNDNHAAVLAKALSNG